jgi:hypothetical protein
MGIRLWLAVSLCLLASVASADEMQTIRAVAKVAGVTKTVDRRVYHLVAVRCYDPEVTAEAHSGSGLRPGEPVVSFADHPALKLSSDEAKTWSGAFFHELRWVALPEKGVLEIRYGLSNRLSGKDPRAAFRVDVVKLPEVKAASGSELSKAMDRLVPREERQSK